MNLEFLAEQLLISCCKRCSVPLVVLIHFSKLFYESKLLGIEDTSDPKCLEEDPWIFGRFRVENIEEKSENPSDRPWGAASTRAPQDKLYLSRSGVSRQPERLRTMSVCQALARCAS